MINKAIRFASLIHSNQYRKGDNGIPYILHPLEAGIIVSQIKFDEDLICAGILHDSVEDAKVGYTTISNIFNEKIAKLIETQSEDKSKSWEDRKQHTIDFLSSVKDEDVKIVALGDKLSNIRAIYRDYQEKREELWERFTVKDKVKQGWYYHSLVNCLDGLSKYPEYGEFKKLVYDVFGRMDVTDRLLD